MGRAGRRATSNLNLHLTLRPAMLWVLHAFALLLLRLVLLVLLKLCTNLLDMSNPRLLLLMPPMLLFPLSY